MIRPDDLLSAADSLATNGAAAVSQAAAHAAEPATIDSLVTTAGPFGAVLRHLSPDRWPADRFVRPAGGTVSESLHATAEQMFGAASTLGAGTAVPPAPTPAFLSGSWIFQCAVLLLAVAYLLLLYTNASEARLLVEGFGRNRTSGRRTLERRGVFHGHFLHRCCVLGVVGSGVLAVRLCDEWLPAGLFAGLSPLGWQSLCVAAMLIVGAIAAVQTVALWSIGQVTLTQSFVTTLLYIKQFHFALATVAGLPAVLLFALCPIGSGSGWFYLAAAFFITIILLFLREIHSLFVAKNISNLHWFLYLCTIEIAPVAFAVLTLIKHS